MTALAFGVIWRYCQLKDGACTASQETLSEKIGITTRALFTHVEILIANGYLEKSSQTGQTVTYRDTGKAGMKITIMGGVEPNSEGSERRSEGVRTTFRGGKNVVPTSILIKKQYKKSGAIAPDAATSQPDYTDWQREFLSTFGAHRFRNNIQAHTVREWPDKYTLDVLRSGLKWAANAGMGLGQAVSALDRALPNWGKPKPGGNGSKPAKSDPLMEEIQRRKELLKNGKPI